MRSEENGHNGQFSIYFYLHSENGEPTDNVLVGKRSLVDVLTLCEIAMEEGEMAMQAGGETMTYVLRGVSFDNWNDGIVSFELVRVATPCGVA